MVSGVRRRLVDRRSARPLGNEVVASGSMDRKNGAIEKYLRPNYAWILGFRLVHIHAMKLKGRTRTAPSGYEILSALEEQCTTATRLAEKCLEASRTPGLSRIIIANVLISAGWMNNIPVPQGQQRASRLPPVAVWDCAMLI